MQRRTLLAGVAVVGGAGAVGHYARQLDDAHEVIADDDDDPMTEDAGGVVGGSSYLDRFEWSESARLDIHFAESHGTDRFSITHATFAGGGDELILYGDAPTFAGPAIVDVRNGIERYGEPLPDRTLALDLWADATIEDADAEIGPIWFGEHVDSYVFDVPAAVDLGSYG